MSDLLNNLPHSKMIDRFVDALEGKDHSHEKVVDEHEKVVDEKMREQLIHKLLLDQEKFIKKEVKKRLGKELSLEEMAKRLSRIVMHDSTEIIQLDGNAIIEFQPVRFVKNMNEWGFKVKANQDYRIVEGVMVEPKNEEDEGTDE